MTVAPGSRLGSYEITAKLGEGGMGEVWRATDTRLRREVAIKVLPAALTTDAERLARFEREAQLLAQLQHPNIAAIFGLEEADGAQALVMELVEGPTLAERMEHGQLSLEETLTIAQQLAEALEAAHEKGIVHRDLKPQNVKLARDGQVKVLDFGLAKAMDRSASGSAVDVARSPTMMDSPTLTAVHGTQLGVILGTAAYMSPEQARGGAVDKRADIWAFGVVLYEMLTGRQLFAGETVSDTLAAVLRQEIDWAALPAATPPSLRTLLRRCLVRSPKERLHDIADARIVLAELIAGRDDDGSPAAGGARATSDWRRWLPAFVGVLALAAAAAWVGLPRRAGPQATLVRSDLAPPRDVAYFFLGDFGAPVVLSPDGEGVVFGGRSNRGGDSAVRLWWRSLETGETHSVAGTEGAFAPFFSPDGRSLGFFAGGQLRTVPVAGGAPFAVAAAPAGRGGAWAPDGTIVFSPNFRDRLWKVPAVGGTPQPLTTVDAARHSTHRWPVLTPAGDGVIYLAASHSPEQTANDELRFVRLDGADDHSLVAALANGAVAAGRLLFLRGSTLLAQPFDAHRGALSGEATAVASEVLFDPTTWRASFAADARRLVHAMGSAAGETRISALDRTGRERQDVTGLGGYRNLALSPDGKRLVVSRSTTPNAEAGDLWILDPERGTETRFTFEPQDEAVPAWSPDGRWIYYGSRGHSDLRDRIFRKRVDGAGAPELIYESSAELDLFLGNLSPDGRSLLVVTGVMPFGVDADIQILRLDGERELRPFLDTPAAEVDPAFSPDGRYVAYGSTESGVFEVYVAVLGADGRAGVRWKVSLDGGRLPVWTPDGRRLLFLDLRDNLMSADVESSGGALRFGRPVPLFSTTAMQERTSFAMAPDGRIWMVLFGEEQGEPMRLIEGWTELLRR